MGPIGKGTAQRAGDFPAAQSRDEASQSNVEGLFPGPTEKGSPSLSRTWGRPLVLTHGRSEERGTDVNAQPRCFSGVPTPPSSWHTALGCKAPAAPISRPAGLLTVEGSGVPPPPRVPQDKPSLSRESQGSEQRGGGSPLGGESTGVPDDHGHLPGALPRFGVTDADLSTSIGESHDSSPTSGAKNDAQGCS
jgi:hypothetical protein